MIPNSNQEMFFSPYSDVVPNYNFKNQIFPYNYNNQNMYYLNYNSPILTSPPVTGQYLGVFSPSNPFGNPYTAPNKVYENPPYYPLCPQNAKKTNYKYPKFRIKTHNEINRNIKQDKFTDYTQNNKIVVQINEYIPVRKKDIKKEQILFNHVDQQPNKVHENLKMKAIPIKKDIKKEQILFNHVDQLQNEVHENLIMKTIPIKKDIKKEQILLNHVDQQPNKVHENLQVKTIPINIVYEIKPPEIKVYKEEIKEKRHSIDDIRSSRTNLKSEYEYLGKNIPPITAQKFPGYFNTPDNQEKVSIYKKMPPQKFDKNSEQIKKLIEVEGINGPNVTSIYLNHTSTLKEELQASIEKNKQIYAKKTEFKNNPISFKKIQPNVGENSKIDEINSNLSSNLIDSKPNQNSIEVSYGLFGELPNSQIKDQDKNLNELRNVNASYILI